MANRNDIEAAIAAETKLANKTIDNKNSNNVNTNNNHSTDANAARMEPMIPTSVAPLVAGLAGGSLSTALLLPLDNIKVRLQVREKSQQQQQRKPASSTTKPSRPSSSSLSPSRAGAYRMLRGIIRHEGVAGLYQGMVPAVLGSSISWGGYFFLYEGFKDRLRRYKAAAQEQSRHDDTHTTIAASDIVLSSFENFQLACSAGAVMVFFTNPIWLIKLRLQLQMKQASQGLLTKKPYSGMLDAARTIVREEGIFALYKGTGPALMLTSHGGVQFVVYEYLRKNFHISRPSRKRVSDDAYQPVLERLEKSLGYLAMGATAKIVASTTTYPLQVLKSRLQQRSEVVELTEEGGVRVAQRAYAGVTKTVGRIWKQEGWRGFFGGCIPNALRVAPSAAITFVVYESVMDWLDVGGDRS